MQITYDIQGRSTTPWSLGMGNLQPLMTGILISWVYFHPYYWVDDHPLLYGNNGSLDPSTCANYIFFSRELTWAYLGILKIMDSTVFWERNVSSQEGTYKHISGQFIIIPKPELRGFWGHFPYFSPPFGVTNRREMVALNCPDMIMYVIDVKTSLRHPGP